MTHHLSRRRSLTLVKVVSEGSALPSAWTLSASGPTPFSGTTGERREVDPGTYTLAESGGPAGYSLVSLDCGVTPVGPGGTITIAEDDDVTCTFTNSIDVEPAVLTLLKEVSEGTASPSAWTLSASGPTPFSGTTGERREVDPGTYTLS